MNLAFVYIKCVCVCMCVGGCEGVACFGDQPMENFMHVRLGENVILKCERLTFNANTAAH